jgi:OmpA-OmpF porin, OOP family
VRVCRWCFGVAAIAAPLAAQGQPVEGFYVGAGAGYDLQQSIRVTPTVPGVGTFPLQAGQSDGFRILGSVGYGLGNGLRLEVEGDFLRTGLRASNITTLPANIAGIAVPAATLNGLVPNNLSGHLLSYGALANVLYDFSIGIPYVVPYVGAGAGVIWNDLTHSGSFAYQAIGGLSFPLAAAPGLSLTAEYRFLDVTAGEQYNTTVAVPGGSVPVHTEVGAQLNHSFLIGVRYAFNSPAAPSPVPAPSPVVASVPARSYLVFFDWDKETLTDRARQIIQEAAKNSQPPE